MKVKNSNKTYRINTKIGADAEDIKINLNILQNYDILEILSLNIGTEGLYKMHTSGYGCVVGRVLANGGVGVPNAKISIFIESNEETLLDEILGYLYPYKTTSDKNEKRIRYNLLPDEQVSECNQIIGTFPNKRLVLDDKNVLEIFDTYYKYTTVTNDSGDYMIFGVPTGNQTLHMDIDLSDIGFLSQKPIDMKYKGYNDTMFETTMQFKTDTNLDSLVQVISQNTTVYVKPFWGEEEIEEIGITRNDIDVNYKFEPTCIFIGSIVSDDNSNGFSKKCVPMPNMGKMEKLTTGHGTIEMIRKRVDGSVEDYPIMGNELIDENGVWCYQIPMNLDYIVTDEYGNIVPTDNPEKGLPTRTRVRFRMSISDFNSDTSNNHLSKILIPNNPNNEKDIDYSFGSYTFDDDEGSKSFRDLFWNNVYTIKSHIPRIQKGNDQRTQKFSGFKNVNINESNNPIPYNNMRVNITFMFTLQCAIIKILIKLTEILNTIFISIRLVTEDGKQKCLTIGDGLCPDLEGWYFSPGCKNKGSNKGNFINNTLNSLEDVSNIDTQSIDYKNNDNEPKCLTTNTDYFMQCLEINLALENDVIQFDFYNDWVNGLVYLPRWYANIKKKASFLFGLIKIKPKVQACLEDTFYNTRKYTQQCAMGYGKDGKGLYTNIKSNPGCKKNKQKCHKKEGRKFVKIFGTKGGIIHQETTIKKQNVYYVKPCEWLSDGKKCNLFATDIVLLGNINKCNLYGIPSDFNGMTPSTFQIPPALAQTNMDSDGVLYGIKGEGINKCVKNNRLTEGVEPVNQTFDGYQKWSGSDEMLDDTTEYAVTELSGIDWGISGPNQGENDETKLYFPGGHFLGVSCGSAQVNIKSCVNLSRICEIGALMSQRQAIVTYELTENGEYKIVYKYLIPTGVISYDEISDNSFRNIFATLNYNRLKTKKNKYGLREYDFIPLQPINFNGDLSNHLNDVKYNGFRKDNPDMGEMHNVSAYTRTIEESSKDYYYFRFGVDDKSIYENSFLLKEEGKYYLPVYENSFYFYYGLKNGATAIDKFLNEYYEQCPTRGERIEPEISIDVTNRIICDDKNNGKVIISYKNIPTPIKYTIKYKDDIYQNESAYDFSEIVIENLKSGKYSIEIENTLYGINIKKDFYVDEIFTDNNEHNLYDGACTMEIVNFYEIPQIKFDEIKKTFTVKPENNGGVIILKTPGYRPDLKSPYIYGYAVTCDGYALCFSHNTKIGSEKRIIESLEKYTGLKYNIINCSHKQVTKEDELLNVMDNTINIYANDDNFNISFKGWQYNKKYDFYVCYTCDDSILSDNVFNVRLINSDVIGVDFEKLSYFLFDKTVTLSDMDIKNQHTILKTIKKNKNKIAYIDYNNISSLTPYEEWSIKKSLYFDGSYYNNDYGAIKIGITGGITPYKYTVSGTCEYFDENDKLNLIEKKDSNDPNFPVDISTILVPTKKWLDDFKDENNNILLKEQYVYSGIDNVGSVPYMETKDKFKCDDETIPDNGGGNDNDNNNSSGIELTLLIEK